LPCFAASPRFTSYVLRLGYPSSSRFAHLLAQLSTGFPVNCSKLIPW
jgi:hypothetical protein